MRAARLLAPLSAILLLAACAGGPSVGGGEPRGIEGSGLRCDCEP